MTIAGFNSQLPTLGVVIFDETEFKTQYPGFVSTAGGILQLCFNLATLLLNNGAGSVVQDANVRQSLLYLLTAHVAKIQVGENGQAPTDVVGRISDAKEGSVSVTSEWATQYSTAQAYYLQTKYGALYWQATMQYRSGMYIPAPPRCYGPPDPRRRYYWQVYTPWTNGGNGNC